MSLLAACRLTSVEAYLPCARASRTCRTNKQNEHGFNMFQYVSICFNYGLDTLGLNVFSMFRVEATWLKSSSLVVWLCTDFRIMSALS